jgi:hypothetical protein
VNAPQRSENAVPIPANTYGVLQKDWNPFVVGAAEPIGIISEGGNPDAQPKIKFSDYYSQKQKDFFDMPPCTCFTILTCVNFYIKSAFLYQMRQKRQLLNVGVIFGIYFNRILQPESRLKDNPCM